MSLIKKQFWSSFWRGVFTYIVGGAAFVICIIVLERIVPAMNWAIVTQNSERFKIFAGVLSVYIAYRYGWRNKRFVKKQILLIGQQEED